MNRKKAKVKRSSLKLLPHASTGRLTHRRHTSYPVLLILLVITGFFVFIGYNIAAADGIVNVGVRVPGPPPSDGAVITTPNEGDSFRDAVVDVEGTCARNTEVVVYSNNTLVGSTLCTASLTFQLQVQLFAGANSLTALNYDTLNQAGPITPAVNVTYNPPTPPPSPPPSPPLPIFPIIVPEVTPTPPQECTNGSTADACHLQYVDAQTCNGYIANKDLPQSADVRVAIVCLPRYIDMLDTVAVGILVWGGQPPYKMTIDWGGNATATTVADVQRVITQPGYYVVTATYKDSGIFNIKLNVTDHNGKRAYSEAEIQVPAARDFPAVTSPQNFGQYIANSFNIPWFDSPVPTYLLAVAVVLGFWAGDYFERAILLKRKGRPKLHRKHS